MSDLSCDSITSETNLWPICMKCAFQLEFDSLKTAEERERERVRLEEKKDHREVTTSI